MKVSPTTKCASCPEAALVPRCRCMCDLIIIVGAAIVLIHRVPLQNYLRLSFSMYDPDDIHLGVQRLAAAIDAVRNRS